MKYKIIICTLLVSLLVLSSIQPIDARRIGVNRSRSWYRTPTRRRYPSAYGYGYAGYGGAPLPAGYGMAEVIRARGEATESVTRAAINNEEARSKYFDNKIKYAEMRRDLRKMGDKYAEERHQERLATQERRKANRTTTPRPSSLNDSQLDPNTGELIWPEELMKSKYEKERKIIEDAFELRRAYSHQTSSSQQNVSEATKKMMRSLKSSIRDIPSSEYLSARRFLELIQNEVRS